MPSFRTPDHHWLRTRIRILCVSVFVLSLFIQPYAPESTSAPPPDIDVSPENFLLAEEGFLMKTSSLTEQGTRSAFSEGIIHTVESGESIASIARSAFLKPETIRWANGIPQNGTVKVGQKLLLLPVDGVLHTVKRGQNIKTIADLYDVDAGMIVQQNKIKGGYLLAGDALIIPGGRPIVEAPPKPPKTVAKQAPLKQALVPPDVKNYTIAPTYGIYQMPCDCFYTQHFGHGHFGIDLQHRGGSPIFAAEAGTVVRAEHGWNGGYGNVIEIDHGNGHLTLYAHNKTLYVKKGDKVIRGQPIAFMGNTGRVHGPTGIHLHFEVHVNGVKKNPSMYLRQ